MKILWTPLIPYSLPEDTVKEFGQKSPIGRPTQPAELAAVYVLLASPEASYITGMVYGVTGGTASCNRIVEQPSGVWQTPEGCQY